MTLRIRPFTPSDADACGDIVGRSALFLRYGVDSTRAARQVAQGAAAGDRVLVAELSGAVAGFTWVTEKGAFGRSDYLKRIAVDESQRGQGIGAALLQAIEGEARAKARDLFLLVSDFNDGAQRFYRAHGYELVGRLPQYVLADVDELVFWKRLT